jgi:Fe-S-cluster-containing hydrogenase components 1
MKGVLVDLTKCIGCGSCTVACKMYNDNKWIEDKAPTQGENALLADENWTVVQKCKVEEEGGKEAWRFVKRQCMHCQDPACVSACLSRAFQKTEEGPIVYYPQNCIGCRYCMIGCPFDIPKFEWNKTFPVLTKCMMCSTRVKEGDSPACVSVCPTNVMKFGEREELLAEAKNLIADNPEKYVPYIYGEEEAGGTNWLYVSDKPFEQLGFKNVSKKSFPALTAPYMHTSPVLGVIWGGILACLYVFTKRRQKVKATKTVAQSEENTESQPGESKDA